MIGRWRDRETKQQGKNKQTLNDNVDEINDKREKTKERG